MPDEDEIETVDAEPMLSVDTRLAGLPAAADWMARSSP
jgi:hypothetical protein